MPASRPATILHEALRFSDPDDREDYLDEACGDDEALRAEVEGLIAAHEKAGEFLDQPLVTVPTSIPAMDSGNVLSEGPGSEIDRYKLLQKIGEGGFGVVYMAEQREPVNRKVALKIIKLGMDTKQVIGRFEAERQALAMMDHPNIAKVLDAGATETGRPYFVMELVRGVPITEYCDTGHLSTKERVNLFIQVCNAVQHAHQKGIIHRDLKPSNVMITMHDGKPMPKVIDFGIAKATNARLTEKTVFTEYRQFIGTPEYMSPEQAEMSGLDIDTRSDIYSLGVLLYELLAGTTPFDSKRLRSAAIGEIQRIIREEEPLKPSTRLSEMSRCHASPALSVQGQDQSAAGWKTAKPIQDGSGNSDHSLVQYIAKHRRTDPVTLSRQLRGDLDWIIMKALEKDRARRYETANGLVMDIERYLDDEPVTARPPRASYKFRKLVKRNKGTFTAAALVFIALALGIVGTTLGLISAGRANEKLVEEAERAERELQRANEVKRLVTAMFTSVTPEIAQGHDITLLRKILDDTAERLSAGEVTDELIAAELHGTVGDVYLRLGLYEQAEAHLAQAVKIRTRVLGLEHSETLKTIDRLGMVYMETGRYADAEPLFQQSLEIRKSMLGKEHRDTADSMNSLAALYWHQERHAEAEPLYLEALRIRESVLGEEHEATLGTMQNLALLYFSQGRFTEAEPLYLGALEGQKRVHGDEHPDTLRTMTNTGFLYLQMEQYDDALAMFETSVPIKERVLGDRHPQTRLAVQGLSVTYMRLGRRDKAMPLHAKQHELEIAMGEENWATPASLNKFAWHALTCSYIELRDPETALRFAQRACALEEAANGTNLWNYLDTLALAQYRLGDTAAAIETQKRAITLIPNDAAQDDRDEILQRLEQYETERNTKESHTATDENPS